MTEQPASAVRDDVPSDAHTHAYSFGIEEEYFIANRRTKALDDRQHKQLLRACKKRLGTRVQTEMLQSQIEIVTPVLTAMAAARDELTHARSVISAVAADHGLGVAAAGTYPLAAWREQRLTDKTRYHVMQDDLQIVGRRNVLCGLHIHVQPPVNASRTDLMNRVMPYMPLLLALSTSSPFWQTQRTGMKGYRLAAYDELPRTGLPEVFRDDGEYQLYIDTLVTSGAIPDASQVWWAIRPSSRYPTLELRIADSCTHMEDALCITALFRCLIRRLSLDHALNAQMNPMWRLLVDENRWRAQRFGIEGAFLDIQHSALKPFPEMIESVVELIAPDAAALDCENEVNHVRAIVARGTSADAQLRIYHEERSTGASRRKALAKVAEWLIQATAGQSA